jgi:serine/threonine-protein kinase
LRAPYSLSLFGSIDLRGPHGAVADLLVQSKAVAMLAYLSVPTMGRFVRRDTLVGLLWPELDQARARKALRQTILAVRSGIGGDALVGRGDEELTLSADIVRCDAAAFASAADAGRLAEALDLYRGELMPGFHLPECAEFDRWLELERAEARERAAGAAWALARGLEEAQKLTDAAGMARRAVRFSWSDERVLRRALGMLERLGDRAGAARLYEDFRARLAADLDIAPSMETMQLIARIRGMAS